MFNKFMIITLSLVSIGLSIDNIKFSLGTNTAFTSNNLDNTSLNTFELGCEVPINESMILGGGLGTHYWSKNGEEDYSETIFNGIAFFQYKNLQAF